MAELKNLKKGDTVILHMFTGIAVGVKEVLAADAKTVTLETRKGNAKFSKATGIQVEPKAKADRFANFITEDDGSFVPREKKSKKTKEKKAAEKSPKKTKKSAEPAEEDDEEEIPAPAKIVSKKTAKKSSKAAKKSSNPVEDDEEFDKDDYEEIE